MNLSKASHLSTNTQNTNLTADLVPKRPRRVMPYQRNDLPLNYTQTCNFQIITQYNVYRY